MRARISRNPWKFALLSLSTLQAACASQPDESAARSMEPTVVASDGNRIAYDVYGNGAPTIVLVHGWSCDRSYWDGQITALARDHRVVTLDLPGHGESGIDRNEWTIESFGNDVASVADALALESMILVGHSMGGDVVLEAARNLTGRVVGLVWIDTYSELGFSRSAEQVDERVSPFRTDFVGTTMDVVSQMFPSTADTALVRRVAMDMAGAPAEIGVGTLTASLSYGRNVSAPIREVSIPIVSINPSNPAPDVESLERHGVRVVLLSGVGHFMMLEEPDRFNETLLGVIAQLVDTL